MIDKTKRPRPDSLEAIGLAKHVTRLYREGELLRPYSKLIELFNTGASDSYAARVMGAHRVTIGKWRKKYKRERGIITA